MWKARASYGKEEKLDHPKFQPYVVSVSLAVFLLYFCILREESGLDAKLNKTLYDHIEGLEEQQLEIALKHSYDMGHEPKHIQKRLQEIKMAKEETTMAREN